MGKVLDEAMCGQMPEALSMYDEHCEASQFCDSVVCGARDLNNGHGPLTGLTADAHFPPIARAKDQETSRLDLLDFLREGKTRFDLLAAFQAAPDIAQVLNVLQEIGDQPRFLFGLRVVMFEQVGIGWSEDIRQRRPRSDAREQREMRLPSAGLIAQQFLYPFSPQDLPCSVRDGQGRSPPSLRPPLVH
jgi:hypothetical protein